MTTQRPYRARRVDNEEEVRGWYVEYEFHGVKFAVIVDEAVDQYLPLVKRMIPVRPDSVSQSTGRKDKNGVEVYGGMWVKASIYGDETPQELQVIWRGTAFIIDYEDSESDCVILSEFVGGIEIIPEKT